uniref:Translation initiation factor 5A C-terminal domain-containing protein n=1 Tax=Oryza glumipatula TaxID=40148 RepID=A0A0E0AHF6_9ORYZ
MSDSEEHHFESKAEARNHPQEWIVIRFLPQILVSTVLPSVTLLPRILFIHPTTVMFHMNRTKYQLIDISDDGLFVSLLTESGNTKDDLGLPTETISWGRSRLDLVKARKEEEIYALKDIGTKVHVANILITAKYAEDLYVISANNSAPMKD